MYKDHERFDKPDENQRIWRYMDFTKFVSLLDKSELFFSRADKLGDLFEGSFPMANIADRPDIYNSKDGVFSTIGGPDLPTFLNNYHDFMKLQPRCTVINCWSMNEHESAALWKYFLKSNEGLVIQSTFKRLKDSIDDSRYEVNIGKVKYVDYETERIPESYVFDPFLYKRKSFEQEHELRALIYKNEVVNKRGKKKNATWDNPPFKEGVGIHVKLDMLIERVYTAPTSPKWLFELIKSILKLYKIKDDIVFTSSLDLTPDY
jgi:hypothetical protein